MPRFTSRFDSYDCTLVDREDYRLLLFTVPDTFQFPRDPAHLSGHLAVGF